MDKLTIDTSGWLSYVYDLTPEEVREIYQMALDHELTWISGRAISAQNDTIPEQAIGFSLHADGRFGWLDNSDLARTVLDSISELRATKQEFVESLSLTTFCEKK